MPPTTPGSGDRRREPRCEVAATATVLAAGSRCLGTYVVENLSAGGALLAGDAALAVGGRVRLLLHLPRRRPIGLTADVLRRDGDPPARRFAVAFRNLTPLMQDAIQRFVLISLQRRRDAAAEPGAGGSLDTVAEEP